MSAASPSPTTPHAVAPANPRITVLVSMLLETWDEGRSPTYFPRTTPLKAGARDEAGIQWAGYGPGEGIWRLMRTIESHGIKATAFCNGLAAERCPDAVERLAAGGHEIAAHGWAQNEYLYEQGRDGQAAPSSARSRHLRVSAAGGPRAGSHQSTVAMRTRPGCSRRPASPGTATCSTRVHRASKRMQTCKT